MAGEAGYAPTPMDSKPIVLLLYDSPVKEIINFILTLISCILIISCLARLSLKDKMVSLCHSALLVEGNLRDYLLEGLYNSFKLSVYFLIQFDGNAIQLLSSGEQTRTATVRILSSLPPANWATPPYTESIFNSL